MEEPQKITPPTSPDWSIEELYRKAWHIVKNNKVLWIFAAAAGGGMSFNNSSSFDSKDFEGLQKLFENKSVPGSEEFAVLGAATNSAGDMLAYLFSTTPFWFYIILGLEILFLILFGIAVSMIYKSFAQGALLESINTCIKDGKASITDASQAAFNYIKPLLFLQIIPGLILTLAAFIAFIIAGIGVALSNGGLRLFFVFAIIVFICLSIYAFLMLALTNIWAPRIVVTDKKSGVEALSSAYFIARKKFWASMLLALINSILSGIITIVPVLAFILLGAGGFFVGWQVETLRIPLVLLGVALFIAFILLLTVGGAVFQAFKATVWSLAYTNIRGKYDSAGSKVQGSK